MARVTSPGRPDVRVRERLLSVNVGRPVELPHRGRTVRTGIVKSPVRGRVALRRLNLEGDGQADLSVHGGEEKAAYVYSWDAYLWWMEELGRRLQPGELGENLTVTGLADGEVRIGDVLRVGEALVAVTGPREPCYKLGIRMGDPRFPAHFLRANRVGFYVRVLEEGTVGAGDEVTRERSDPESPTIAEIHRLYAHARDDRPALRRLVASPALPTRWREWAERRLAHAERRQRAG
jgi:MOSC domain-containing protein YiiM